MERSDNKFKNIKKGTRSDNTDLKIVVLEEELSTTKYNKRTQHHIGDIKAKIARLKEEHQKNLSSKGKGHGFLFKKTGDATAVVIGFPSVGKSTLLNAITNANSPVAEYAFTTLTCIPGMLDYNDAKIQVLDLPGILEGASAGRGSGKEVLACLQSADLLLILVDVINPGYLNIIIKELNEVGIRINQHPPLIKIIKRAKGGIDLNYIKLTKTNEENIKTILKEFRLNNCSVIIKEDITDEQLIDFIDGNKKYMPTIISLNKIDLVEADELENIKSLIKPDICISAGKKLNTEELKGLIFKKLDILRIYCKEAGKKADTKHPLIIKKELGIVTLKDVCLKLHKDFLSKFKYARIWGKSSKFPGIPVRRLDYVVEDGDIIEIHLS